MRAPGAGEAADDAAGAGAFAVWAPVPSGACPHTDTSFSRTLCACDRMHDYCDDCGAALDCPLEILTEEMS